MTTTIYETYNNPGQGKHSKFLIGQFTEVNIRNGATSSALSMEEAKFTLQDTFVNRLAMNWDGYGAQPLSIGAYIGAKKFLELLPANIDMPDIVPEPSGSIGLEWYHDKHNVISIGFHGETRASYASLIKNLPHDGEFSLAGEEIPATVKGLIKDYHSQRPA